MPSCVTPIERGYAKDVTKRYAAAWGARTLKLRHVPAEWWLVLLSGGRHRGPPDGGVGIALGPDQANQS